MVPEHLGLTVGYVVVLPFNVKAAQRLVTGDVIVLGRSALSSGFPLVAVAFLMLPLCCHHVFVYLMF